MDKVLFIVPHEDDELFVGGGMIMNLTGSGNYEVNLFIATNGDYFASDCRKRIYESTRALLMMGIHEENIIFGGYGDNWKSSHIYNSPDNCINESCAGKKSTYLPTDINEWHYTNHGKHAVYTRSNYCNDIYDVINRLQPDTIVCVDMDIHPDHKALSLMTDEVLKKILLKKPLYHPCYLKKYAYNGMYSSGGDYFVLPHKQACTSKALNTGLYFNDNNCIRYTVPDACNTERIWNNTLFKISKTYKTQKIWVDADKFLNSDVIYWQRNVDNKALFAKISTTSGNNKWLNDFKLLDTDNVKNENDSYINCCWRPDSSDKEKLIHFALDNKAAIKIINLYCNSQNLRGSINVFFYGPNHSFIKESAFPICVCEPSMFTITCSEAMEIQELEISFKEALGDIAITEIELLTEESTPPFSEFLSRKDTVQEVSSSKTRIVMLLDKFLFKIMRTIVKRTHKYKCNIRDALLNR